eukprot:3933635-Prymnesium_polylepis.1
MRTRAPEVGPLAPSAASAACEPSPLPQRRPTGGWAPGSRGAARSRPYPGPHRAARRAVPR